MRKRDWSSMHERGLMPGHISKKRDEVNGGAYKERKQQHGGRRRGGKNQKKERAIRTYREKFFFEGRNLRRTTKTLKTKVHQKGTEKEPMKSKTR